MTWAVLFNSRDDPQGVEPATTIDPLVHGAADAVTNWPPKPLVSYSLGSATLSDGITTTTFAFYVVDANTLRLIETDTTSGNFQVGSAFGQGGVPNFTNASLSGSYAFTGSGTALGLRVSNRPTPRAHRARAALAHRPPG